MRHLEGNSLIVSLFIAYLQSYTFVTDNSFIYLKMIYVPRIRFPNLFQGIDYHLIYAIIFPQKQKRNKPPSCFLCLLSHLSSHA